MMFLGEFRTSPVLQPLLYHYIIYREKCNYYIIRRYYCCELAIFSASISIVDDTSFPTNAPAFTGCPLPKVSSKVRLIGLFDFSFALSTSRSLITSTPKFATPLTLLFILYLNCENIFNLRFKVCFVLSFIAQPKHTPE